MNTHDVQLQGRFDSMVARICLFAKEDWLRQFTPTLDHYPDEIYEKWEKEGGELHISDVQQSIERDEDQDDARAGTATAGDLRDGK